MTESPPDQRTQKILARLAAIETVLAGLAAITYRAAGMSREDVARSHKAIRELVSSAPIPTTDPVASDHISAELHEAYDTLLEKIENSFER